MLLPYGMGRAAEIGCAGLRLVQVGEGRGDAALNDHAWL
jgi:hypothetical protein